MNIINHGIWTAYTPDPLPAGLLPGTAFAKSATGQDWYDALYGASPLITAGSVAVTAIKDTNGVWRTQAASKDPTMVFPVNQLLLEVTDYTGSSAQADFGGKQYIEETNEIVVLPVVTAPVVVTQRQVRLALFAAGLLDQVEQTITAAGGATKIAWDFATTISRDDPLVASIGSALNLTSDQIDVLFKYAASQPS